MGVGNSVASVTFDQAIPAAFRSGTTLWIQGKAFVFDEGSISNSDKTVGWPDGGLRWGAGDEVRISLTAPRPPIWSDTLTAKALTGIQAGSFGCGFTQTIVASQCNASGALNSDRISYGGSFHLLADIYLTSTGTLTFATTTSIPDSVRQRATLHVGNRQFTLATATVNSSALSWSSTGLSWSANQQVQLSLTVAPPSSGVDLSTETLAITEGSSGSGTFTVALGYDSGTDTTVTLVRTQYFQADIGQSGHRWKLNAATLSPETLTFTAGSSGNYATAQSVMVTGVEDCDNRDDQLVILVLVQTAARTGDDSAEYRPVSGAVTGVFVTINDDETGSGCGGL